MNWRIGNTFIFLMNCLLVVNVHLISKFVVLLLQESKDGIDQETIS